MLSSSVATPEDNWQLELSPVGYQTAEEMKSFSHPYYVTEASNLKTFPEWYLQKGHEPKPGVASVGLFCHFATMSTASPRVAYEAGIDRAWTVTLRDLPGGTARTEKELIIWSPWAPTKLPRYGKGDSGSIPFYLTQDLPYPQERFVLFLLSRKCKLGKIWVGGANEEIDWFAAGNWLLDTLIGPRMKLPDTAQSLKSAGYVEVLVPKSPSDSAKKGNYAPPSVADETENID